ncbi:holin [Shouchella miscanthi]|uniref:holin n=1 Tax=Shouchella miscanthi TaxID=2598861 RepID=UPI0011A8604D|nr:holin [Shouchella miscanthi]
MQEVVIFATALAPIILALVELVKKTAKVPVNLIPLIALVIGLLIGAAAFPFTEFDLILRLWAGGFAGLSATGLFELAFKKREGTTKGDK